MFVVSHVRLIIITVILTMLVFVIQGVAWLFIPQSSGECNPDLWKSVYRPQRYKILDKCKAIKGVVKSVKKQKNGIQILYIKPINSEVLTEKNKGKLKGQIIAKTVCQNALLVPKGEQCRPYIAKPKIGARVEVVGVLVENTKDVWNEIYPITKVAITNR
jgi:hypothetical protein